MSDYYTETASKKYSRSKLKIEFTKDRDLLKEFAATKPKGTIVVGFAAETHELIKNARQKLESKKLDLVVANQIGQTSHGFGSDKNKVCLITKEETVQLPLVSKREIASKIVRKIIAIKNGD